MKVVPLIILLCLLITAAGAAEITEFCPDTWLKGEADEYIVINGTGPARGLAITDGEGMITFPEDTLLSGRTVIARQADAYYGVHGSLPDYEWLDSDPEVPDMRLTGDLRLANRADSLSLLLDNEVVQRVAWPEDVCTREGQVHVLENGVWDRRPHLIGQSALTPARYEDVSLLAFVSPDSSYEALNTALDDADSEVLLNVYEFTDARTAERLATLSREGVSVRVLLEGGPVGGISDEERAVAGLLTEAGAWVGMMTSTDEAHARYRFDHAKYMVIDDEAVLVMSENLKPTGVPERGQTGNRGWGVYITDTGVAEEFSRVFELDAGGRDIMPMEGEGLPEAGDDGETYVPLFRPEEFTGAVVTPVFSPDTSCLIEELVRSAEVSVDIEQAYIKDWKDGSNPYLEAAIEAAGRGVEVRILMDSYWFNIEGDDDNDEMAESINALAQEQGLPMEARCVYLKEAGFLKIHNKGVIVDNRKVLVSSINWNENSPSFNREAGVIIDEPGAGAYFTEVFESDWNLSADKAPDLTKMWVAAGVILLLLLIYAGRIIKNY